MLFLSINAEHTTEDNDNEEGSGSSGAGLSDDDDDLEYSGSGEDEDETPETPNDGISQVIGTDGQENTVSKPVTNKQTEKYAGSPSSLNRASAFTSPVTHRNTTRRSKRYRNFLKLLKLSQRQYNSSYAVHRMYRNIVNLLNLLKHYNSSHTDIYNPYTNDRKRRKTRHRVRRNADDTDIYNVHTLNRKTINRVKRNANTSTPSPSNSTSTSTSTPHSNSLSTSSPTFTSTIPITSSTSHKSTTNSTTPYHSETTNTTATGNNNQTLTPDVNVTEILISTETTELVITTVATVTVDPSSPYPTFETTVNTEMTLNTESTPTESTSPFLSTISPFSIDCVPFKFTSKFTNNSTNAYYSSSYNPECLDQPSQQYTSHIPANASKCTVEGNVTNFADYDNITFYLSSCTHGIVSLENNKTTAHMNIDLGSVLLSTIYKELNISWLLPTFITEVQKFRYGLLTLELR